MPAVLCKLWKHILMPQDYLGDIFDGGIQIVEIANLVVAEQWLEINFINALIQYQCGHQY